MKLSIILLLALICGPATVTADRLIRYLFPLASTSCTATDNAKIDAVFNPVRRELGTSPDSERALASLDCKRTCARYVPGTCRVAGCSATSRRELSEAGGDRELQVQPTCTDAMRSINAKLGALIDTYGVSNSCRLAINSSNRRASCFDDVIYGVVEAVTLWNIGSSPPTVMANHMENDMYICASTTFNIEARVNPCVDFVNFRLTGPNYSRTHTEDGIPYSLFGDDDSNRMYGRKLSRTGWYNLVVTPDGFTDKAHDLWFYIGDC
jgi:hypothetical protein